MSGTDPPAPPGLFRGDQANVIGQGAPSEDSDFNVRVVIGTVAASAFLLALLGGLLVYAVMVRKSSAKAQAKQQTKERAAMAAAVLAAQGGGMPPYHPHDGGSMVGVAPPYVAASQQGMDTGHSDVLANEELARAMAAGGGGAVAAGCAPAYASMPPSHVGGPRSGDVSHTNMSYHPSMTSDLNRSMVLAVAPASAPTSNGFMYQQHHQQLTGSGMIHPAAAAAMAAQQQAQSTGTGAASQSGSVDDADGWFSGTPRHQRHARAS